MKRNIYALTFYAAIALCFSCGQRPLGEHIGVTTYSYAVKDGDTLHMDVYLDSTKLHADEKLPVFLFSFGGGWTSGKRQDGQALLEDAAHHGYVGVGIDYRLGIRALSKQGVNIDSTNFASSYSMAITWGIEDLFDATCFVIDHADELHADTCRIIACGSSAGATNSLTAEYLISTHDSLAASRWPGRTHSSGSVRPVPYWPTTARTTSWCHIIRYSSSREHSAALVQAIICLSCERCRCPLCSTPTRGATT